MERLFVFAMLVVASPFALASFNDHVFMCNVVGYDVKTAKLACDPNKPKNQMKTPREWLNPDEKLKAGATIKFVLDDTEFEKWLAMNNSPMAQKKGKAQ